jgi:hypothetical protein
VYCREFLLKADARKSFVFQILGTWCSIAIAIRTFRRIALISRLFYIFRVVITSLKTHPTCAHKTFSNAVLPDILGGHLTFIESLLLYIWYILFYIGSVSFFFKGAGFVQLHFDSQVLGCREKLLFDTVLLVCVDQHS